MSLDRDQLVQETTDRVLACVGDILGLAGVTGKVPVRAVVVYEVLNSDGGAEIDFVGTASMGATDVIGFGHFLREAATADLLDDDAD